MLNFIDDANQQLRLALQFAFSLSTGKQLEYYQVKQLARYKGQDTIKLQAKNLIQKFMKEKKELELDCVLDISDLLLIPEFLSENSRPHKVLTKVASNVNSLNEVST